MKNQSPQENLQGGGAVAPSINRYSLTPTLFYKIVVNYKPNHTKMGVRIYIPDLIVVHGVMYCGKKALC